MAISDGATNQTYVYLGAKQAERTHLQLLVPGVYAEDRNTNLGIAKSIVGKGEVWPRQIRAHRS